MVEPGGNGRVAQRRRLSCTVSSNLSSFHETIATLAQWISSTIGIADCSINRREPLGAVSSHAFVIVIYTRLSSSYEHALRAGSVSCSTVWASVVHSVCLRDGGIAASDTIYADIGNSLDEADTCWACIVFVVDLACLHIEWWASYFTFICNWTGDAWQLNSFICSTHCPSIFACAHWLAYTLAFQNHRLDGQTSAYEQRN